MSDKKEQTVTELAAETLTGDIRDWLLMHLRDMQKPWAQMSEREQREKINSAESASRDFVRKGVNIIAAKEFDKVFVRVGKFTVKDGEIKGEFTCNASHDNLLSISDAGSAVLVLADSVTFAGERAEALPDPDEPYLPIDDEDDERTAA
jgi:hypothetical protein